MSLWDRVRGERVGTNTRAGHSASRQRDIGPESSTAGPNAGSAVDSIAAGLSGTVELTEFAPRQDGDYRCTERGLYLRFARPIVTETVTETASAAATDTNSEGPARSEFTTSGRFTVQRPFARPIVYTVLGDGTPGNDAALVVRRTDTATREAVRLEFVFEPDRQ